MSSSPFWLQFFSYAVFVAAVVAEEEVELGEVAALTVVEVVAQGMILGVDGLVEEVVMEVVGLVAEGGTLVGGVGMVLGMVEVEIKYQNHYKDEYLFHLELNIIIEFFQF